MAKPKVDFKKLMLEKGEKYGVGVGAAIMVLLIVWGISAASGSVNTDKTASELSSQATGIKTKIATGPAGEVKPLEPWITNKVVYDPIDPLAHMNKPYFVDIEIDSLKRGRPMIFGPTEFQVDIVREPIYRYQFIYDEKDGLPKSIYVVQEKKKGEPLKINELKENFTKFNKKRAYSGNRNQRGPGGGAPGVGGPGMGGPGMGGPGSGGPGVGGPGMGGPGMGGPGMGGPGMGGPGMGGPGMGGPGMGGPGMGGGGYGGFPGGPAGGSGSGYSSEVVRELVTVPIKDFLEGNKNITPAQFTRPMRAVVFAASFPWRKQLEEFQKKLRFNTLNELIADQAELPQFKGFKLKRRVTTPDGRVGAWEDYDWQAAYEPIFMEKIVKDHEDPPELAPVIPSEETKLFVPLPKLVRGEYPKVALPSIERTLTALKNSNQGDRVVPGGSKLEGGGDIFARGGGKSKKTDANKNEQKTDKAQEVQEAFLMRFLDVDVLPGYTYEYQIQVKVANPNYNKKDKVGQPSDAAAKELESAPVTIAFKDGEKTTSAVRIPEERFAYAFAQEAKDGLKPDHVRLQLQNWLESVRIDRSNSKSKEPVGDWVVEDIQIPRGQFVIGTKPVKMPIWSPTKDAFVFMEFGKIAKPGTSSSKDKGMLPVDLSAPYLLVDFEGGAVRANIAKKYYVSDEAGTEVLLLGEDGKLRVRSAWTDVADRDRIQREKDWLAWQKETKDAGTEKSDKSNNPFDKGGTPGK